ADAYLRLVVTRGSGDLGLDPRKCPKPSIILIVDEIQLWPADRYDKGLTALTAATPIGHRESLSPRIKSLNYLAHILAKVEGIAAGVICGEQHLDVAVGAAVQHDEVSVFAGLDVDADGVATQQGAARPEPHAHGFRVPLRRPPPGHGRGCRRRGGLQQ